MGKSRSVTPERLERPPWTRNRVIAGLVAMEHQLLIVLDLQDWARPWHSRAGCLGFTVI